MLSLGALAAVLLLVCGFGLWRLTQGPIDFDRLAPYVQEVLSWSAGGRQIAISGVRLGVDPASHELDLSIKGVRLSQPDGEPLAAFPEMSASFSLRSILRGVVAPTRLVIERPVLRVIRDKEGGIHFRFGDHDGDAASFGPELLEQAAGPTNPDAQFGLMRRVAVRDATLILDDRQSGRRWRTERVDAAIERSPEGLSGDLSLAVAVGERKPEFHATYRYSSSSRMLDLTVELGAVQPAALAALAPEFAPLATADFPISGTVATRLDVAGLTHQGMRVDLHFGKGSLKSDLLSEGVLALQEGSLHAVYAPESGQVRLAKLELDLGGGSVITVEGSLDGITPALVAGRDPLPASIPGKLGIVLADVPVAKFESLWPPALSAGGRRWVLANVHDGVLDHAAVQLDLDVDPAARAAEVTSARGTMRYHDATINYFNGLVPVKKVSGTAALEDKRLVFTPTGGTVKSVQITGGSVQITDLGAPVEWLAINLAVAGPIQDVVEIIDAKPLRYAHEIGIDPARVAGRTEANLHFKLPLLRDLKIDHVDYAVKASLTGAAVAEVAMNRNLSDGRFAVEINRSGARLEGSGRFDGVPLNIDGGLFFKPRDGARARYRVALTLNEEQRRRLAFDFLPDRIAGPVGVDLTYWVIDGGHAEAEALLDLRNASLSVAEAGWKKPPGAPASAKLGLDFVRDKVTRLPEIEITAAGLDGKFALTLAPGGEAIKRVDIQRLAVGNTDVMGSAMRRRDGGWYIDLRGSRLDLSHWIKDFGKGDRRQKAAADTPLLIDMQLARLILGPRREVHDFVAKLSREGADWKPAQIDARFANGRQLTLRSASETGGHDLTFRSDDFGATLSLLNITDNVVGGQVTVTGQFSDAAGKRILQGHIKGTDYSLVQAPVFARILSLPSFSGAGAMLAGSGIPFSTLRGDFAYSDNHVVLENLLAYGGAIGVTANGLIDVAPDRLDLQGTIVPAYALNSIIGNIPVIGSLLMGGEGQGLFAANYRVTGSSGDPQVSVNPLSALAPGFLRRLFQPNFGMPPPIQQSLGIE